jgi:hypothetical protein
MRTCARRFRVRGAARVPVSVAMVAVGCGMASHSVATAAGPSSGHSRAAAAPRDWPAYLNGSLHTSYSASQTAITPGTARNLVQAWHFAPGVDFLASPTVADGAVFIGSDLGWFYRLRETTGAVLDKRFIGYQPAKTCGALGTVATATVATDPRNHRLTVYVTGANGYLYALNAANLTLKWTSHSAYTPTTGCSPLITTAYTGGGSSRQGDDARSVCSTALLRKRSSSWL